MTLILSDNKYWALNLQVCQFNDFIFHFFYLLVFLSCVSWLKVRFESLSSQTNKPNFFRLFLSISRFYNRRISSHVAERISKQSNTPFTLLLFCFNFSEVFKQPSGVHPKLGGQKTRIRDEQSISSNLSTLLVILQCKWIKL